MYLPQITTLVSSVNLFYPKSQEKWGKNTLSGAPPIKNREEVTIRFYMIADVSSYSDRNVIQELALSQLKESVGFNLSSVRHF